MDPIRVPPEMFRFTSGERAGLYAEVLHAFAEANERMETALGLDDVRVGLRSVGWLESPRTRISARHSISCALGICST